MSNAIEIYNQFDQLQKAATALQASGYFKDVTSQAQAVVKVMAGAELGLPPFAAMTGINIIQGKPVLGANVIATLVKNDPRYDYRVKLCTDQECIIEWFEDKQFSGVSTFNLDEAKRAGLNGKDNWTKYPSDMLFARAISRGARRYAPGIFGGSPVYTPDEMGAEVDADGNVVVEAGEWKPEQAPAEPLPAPSSLMTIDMANSIKNKEGVLYKDLPTDKLSYMHNELIRKLEANGLSPEKREEAQMKIDAIRVILAGRQTD